MVDIHIDYEGDLRTTAKHGPSGTSFVTDAPVDNHGKGESFSPTDLLATALGTCMITVMGIWAKSQNIELRGTHVHIKKIMTRAAPRRVARLESTIRVPRQVAASIDEPARAELRKIAETCPVRLSLHDSIEVPLTIEWSAS
jgi:putative redox protein